MSSYSCVIQVNNRDEILTLLNFCVIIAQNKYFAQLRGLVLPLFLYYKHFPVFSPIDIVYLLF